MNARRNVGRTVEESVSGRNQARPQAPAVGVQMTINAAVLTDGDVRATLL